MLKGSETTEVRYLVLPNIANPYLLAMVRFPDVAQAISQGQPEWQGDPGLFDLPYDPSSVAVSPAHAASIAARWGARLPSDKEEPASSLIRRMPANWSNLSPAEKRAWSLEYLAGWRRAAPLSRIRRRSARPADLGQAGNGFSLPDATGDGSSPSNGSYLASGGRSRQTPATRERRRHARVRVRGRARLSIGRKTVLANLVNVSQGGANCVVADGEFHLAPGGLIEAPLMFEDQLSLSQVSLDVAASVAWRSDTGTGTQFGLVFGELNNDQAELVQQFLSSVGSETGS
jgi:hypothetical protein